VFLVVRRNRSARNAPGGPQGQFPPDQPAQQPMGANPYQPYPQAANPYIVDAYKDPGPLSPPQGYAELGSNPVAPHGYYEMPAGK
jgi:hypothetical protein